MAIKGPEISNKVLLARGNM